MECFDARVATLGSENRDMTPKETKKAVLMEVSQDFGWSEKELRNRMCVLTTSVANHFFLNVFH